MMEPTATDCVRQLLRDIEGEDADREGLRDTPARFVKALREMTAGYGEDPARDYLRTTFPCTNDEMVVVRDIPFSSLCEHHLLPFIGKAHVGYVPNGCVVGLSKIPRTVQAFAKRLQIQEAMTQQIADAMQDALAPSGVAVIVEGTHQCMSCRGVRATGASMVTSSMSGVFRADQKARAEFLDLVRL